LSSTWCRSQAAGRRRARANHQQAGDDLLDPVELLDNVLEILPARIGGLNFDPTNCHGGADPGERIANLVAT